MKENFLLKKNQKEVFETLSDEDAGKLIKGIFEYCNSGESNLDGYLKIIFIPIKNDIDKNEDNYQKRIEKNKENGAKGGRPKKQEKPNETQKNQSVFSKTQKNMNNHIHIHNHIHNQIIDYLNNKIDSKYKYNTKTTIEKINARLNEGYNLNDFIAVIDNKYDEWVGTEFEKYLCPETLFGTKFEKYLNQKKEKNDKEIKEGNIYEQYPNLDSDEYKKMVLNS